MRAKGYGVVTPRLPAEPMVTAPFIEMTSGYFDRGRDAMPLQGDRAPWRLKQHHVKDAALFRGPVDAEDLEFRTGSRTAPVPGDPIPGAPVPRDPISDGTTLPHNARKTP